MPDRAVARSSMSQEGLGALLVRRGPFLDNDEVDSDEGVRRDPFLDSDEVSRNARSAML